MTKKVRITSFLTAAVLAFTMGGVKLEKTNDYEGEHVRFSIVATANAEAKDYFMFKPLTFADKDYKKVSLDEGYLTAAYMYLSFGALLEVMPEIIDQVLTPEEKQILNDNRMILYDLPESKENYGNYINTLLPIYSKVFSYYCNYMSTLEPLSKDLTAKNGEDLYSQAKRLYLEAGFLMNVYGIFYTSSSFGTLNANVPKLGEIIAEMEDPDYNLEANYATDYKRVNAIYSKITGCLGACYKEVGINPKYNKTGARVERKIATIDVDEIVEDPVDYEAYFPYAKILDPFDYLGTEYYDREWEEMAIVWSGTKFISEGWLDIIVEETGYDPTTPQAKIYWNRVKNCVKTNSIGTGSFEATYAAFHEFTTYLEKYFRMHHLERKELNTTIWTKLEGDHEAFYIMCHYLMDLLGTYSNDPDSGLKLDNTIFFYSNLVFRAQGMSNQEKFDNFGERLMSDYANGQSELVTYITNIVNTCFYNGDILIPVFEEPTQLTK